MSQDDSFQVFEEKPDHAYRTEIPNIIFELSLDLHEFKLYCFYKKVAGDKSCCTMSQENIAKKIGISADKQKKCNEKFRRPFEQLGGKSLIRFYQTRKENGSQGSNQILIVDIWKENGKFYRGKTEKKCPEDNVSQLPLPAGTPPAPNGTKKNLIKEEQTEVSQSFASQSSSPLAKKLISLMKKRGVKPYQQNQVKEYPSVEVELSMKYCLYHEIKKKEVGEVMEKFGTYLIMCLKNRWYESDSFDPEWIRINLDIKDGQD